MTFGAHQFCAAALWAPAHILDSRCSARPRKARPAPPAMVAAVQPARADEASPPPRKRVRVEQQAKQGAPAKKEPRLFAPFRALGLVTNHVPFVLQARSYKGSTEGPSLSLVTCLGKAWAMWEGGKMTLQFVGQ